MSTLKEVGEQKWFKNKKIMIPIAAFLIIRGVYTLVTPSDRYNIGSSDRWSQQNKKILTDKCMKDAADKATNFPTETRVYCECTTENIVKSLTLDEYLANAKEPIEAQLELLVPLIQGCLDELNRTTND
ncbi:MAG: hypothetical protein RIC80_03160 [Cyclobacteriaceae bacterium]